MLMTAANVIDTVGTSNTIVQPFKNSSARSHFVIPLEKAECQAVNAMLKDSFPFVTKEEYYLPEKRWHERTLLTMNNFCQFRHFDISLTERSSLN